MSMSLVGCMMLGLETRFEALGPQSGLGFRVLVLQAVGSRVWVQDSRMLGLWRLMAWGLEPRRCQGVVLKERERERESEGGREGGRERERERYIYIIYTHVASGNFPGVYCGRVHTI